MNNAAILNKFSLINKIQNNNGLNTQNNVISFGNRTCYKKLQRIIENDSKQPEPVILSLKEGFLQKAIKLFKEEKVVTAGIAGESNSGKTTLTEKIVEGIRGVAGEKTVSVVNTDNYYKDFSALVRKLGGFVQVLQSGYSLDVPKAVDLKQLRIDCKKLKQGIAVKIPEYKRDDTGISIPAAIPIKSAKLVISEGLFNLHPRVRDAFDIKLYVHTPDEVIKDRWYMRAGKSPFDKNDETHFHFQDVIAKAIKNIRPTKASADVILNGKASIQSVQELIKNIYKTIKNGH
ncbi:MAG TPA: hypothetical protein DDW90_05380 [Cyanobacteria bacterium UBA9971]|nr:hypothetical protein [Cyanobacteria bacterium UBA9971]